MRLTQPPDLTDPSLTPRQSKIIQVIEDSMQRCGYAPTLREIGEAAGLASTSSVSHHLSSLEKKGYLSRGAGRPRTAVVRPASAPASLQADQPRGDSEQRGDSEGPGDVVRQRVAHVPLVGRIAAGGPILAEQSVDDVFPLPRQLVGENRATRRDAPHQRHMSDPLPVEPTPRRFGLTVPLLDRRSSGRPDYGRARAPRAAAQVSLLLQHRELVRDARCARQPCCFADLPQCGPVAVALYRVLDGLHDFALTRGEVQAGPVGLLRTAHRQTSGQ